MAGSLELRLTGGASNDGPTLSLGGVMSSVALAATALNNLFDDVITDEIYFGRTEYRAFDIYNSGDMDAEDVDIYFNPASDSPDVTIQIGLETGGNPHASSWDGQEISNEIAPPSNVTFAAYTSGSPLRLENIPVGEACRVWFKRIVAAKTKRLIPNTCTFNIDGTFVEVLNDLMLHLTADSLSLVAGVDFAEHFIITHHGTVLDTDHQLYGVGCWDECDVDITSDGANLDLLIKNMLFNIYFPVADSGTFNLLNIFDAEDNSLCLVSYNAGTGKISIGSAVTDESILIEGMYHVVQLIEDESGNYLLKIDNEEISLTGTQAVPTDINRIKIGNKNAGIFFDNIMSAK